MTLTETRQLGIEVERRLQTILPTLKLQDKLDTEDIYSFLNQFQKQLVDAIYAQNDQAVSGTLSAVLVEDILRTLTKHAELTTATTDPIDNYDEHCNVYNLPSDYYQYIRSVSNVSGTYNNKSANTKVSNIIIKQTDANKIINQYYDKNRILRNPAVVLEGNDRLKLIHDTYTTVNSISLTYIKRPANFSVLTGVACDLPYKCFEPLVSGTVDLYIRHLTSTQPKQQKQQKQEAE